MPQKILRSAPLRVWRRGADDFLVGTEPDLGDEHDLGWVKYDGELRIWTGPFAMAAINTRVVVRNGR